MDNLASFECSTNCHPKLHGLAFFWQYSAVLYLVIYSVFSMVFQGKYDFQAGAEFQSLLGEGEQLPTTLKKICYCVEENYLAYIFFLFLRHLILSIIEIA